MNAWGIDDGYHDIRGTWHPTEPETRDAILRAMGADPNGFPPDPPVRVVRRGARLPFGAEILMESGETGRVEPGGGTTLPLGYHTARLDRVAMSVSGKKRSLIRRLIAFRLSSEVNWPLTRSAIRSAPASTTPDCVTAFWAWSVSMICC